MVKHINADKNRNSQKAQQAKARLERQRQRGSKKFGSGSNPHNGASRSQSGQKNQKRS